MTVVSTQISKYTYPAENGISRSRSSHAFSPHKLFENINSSDLVIPNNHKPYQYLAARLLNVKHLPGDDVYPTHTARSCIAVSCVSCTTSRYTDGIRPECIQTYADKELVQESYNRNYKHSSRILPRRAPNKETRSKPSQKPNAMNCVIASQPSCHEKFAT
jgi:hypothetical protein